MRTVVITGASAGIGKQMAIKFAQAEKAHLVLAARSIEKLDEVAAAARKLGSDVLVVPTDVTKPEAIANLLAATLEKFGRVDMLINNAGLGFVKPIFELTDEEIIQMIAVDVQGMIVAAKYFSAQMVKQKAGHIVNLSSIAGFFPTPNWSVYCAAKYAIRGFSDCIRTELKPYGITVTTIHPGPIKTEFWERGKIAANEKTMLSVEECADQMYDAINHKKQRAIIPAYFGILEAILRLFPWVYDILIRALQKQYLRPQPKS